MTWADFSILLTAIATVGLVWIGFRQSKIQKTQTDIQKQAVKISLLERRLSVFELTNHIKTAVLNENSFRESFILSVLDSANYTKQINSMIKLRDDFSIASKNAKILFDKKISDNLTSCAYLYEKNINISLEIIFVIERLKRECNKDLLIFTQNCVENSLKFDEKKLPNEIKEFINNSKIIELQNELKKLFSNEEFFNSFDEYLDISKI